MNDIFAGRHKSRMTVRHARGGSKPRMLQGSSDLLLTIGNMKKTGIYELSAQRDVIARRVELPGWLSDAYHRGGDNALATALMANMPRHEIHESRGHIYLRPPRDLFDGPAVGIDLEIYDALLRNRDAREVRFFVYATGYRLADVWGVGKQSFLDNMRLVETKAFMPQMMVSLRVLNSVSSIVQARKRA